MQQLTLLNKPEGDEQAVIERHKYGIEVGMCVEAWLRYRANPATGITGTTIAMQVAPTESHGPDVQFLVRIDEEHYELIVPDQPYLPYGVSHCCNRPVPLEQWYSGLYLKQIEE